MRQGQRSQHEDDCRTGGQLVHEGVAAAGSEYGLATAGSEGCPHFGTFARLQQNYADQGYTDKHMQKNKYVCH